MAPRAAPIGLKNVAALIGLPPAERLRLISQGLPLLLESANELDAAADKLDPGGLSSEARRRSLVDVCRRSNRVAEMLRALAAEEAAKILVLLDAVRCPQNRSDDLNRTLRHVNDHLAKHIYAGMANWHMATFGEVERAVAMERPSHHLDGPDGYDYIMPNLMLDEREGLLYTDLAQYEHGLEWHRAGRSGSAWSQLAGHLPIVLALAQALQTLGAFTERGLLGIQTLWDDLELHDATHWTEIEERNRRTVEYLRAKGLFDVAAPDEHVSRVLRWPFPMYSLCLRRIIVTKEELERIREAAPGLY